MIAFLLLFPMVLVSMTMSIFVSMFGAALTIAMGVFMGTLIVFSTGFMAFMILIFS